MGEVGRVLRVVDEALGDQGIVWASSEDRIEGKLARAWLGPRPVRGKG